MEEGKGKGGKGREQSGWTGEGRGGKNFVQLVEMIKIP